MRDIIATAIVAAFERTYAEHGVSYDPDTCYEAADEVIATLVNRLTGQAVAVERNPRILGPGRFVVGNRS